MHNILVEASAGTGKTHRLVERIVEGIRTGQFRAGRVAAITFTRKAASELRGRLRQELEILPFVGTIHAFCAQLVRAFPVEAGLSHNFRELDEMEELEGLKSALSTCQRDLDIEPRLLWSALQAVHQHGELDFPAVGHEYAKVVTVLLRAREDYRNHRLRHGLLSFQDLLHKALELATMETVQNLYDAFLVDEFQDTDPLQVELLLRLTRQRPGSLFLVGDPKQSIYRFRGADMRTYQALRRSWPGSLEELNVTRRSTPELCRWLNRVFADLFPPQPSEAQAHYRALSSMRSPAATPPVYQLACAQPRHEAERIAGFILGAVRDGSHRFGDFLVLATRNRPLRLFYEVFQRLGIPCEAPLRRVPLSGWAAGLLPLLRHLVDPQDKAILVGVLRGPLFGYSDRELYQHVQLAGTLRPYPPEAGLPSIAASLQKLNEWRLRVRWLPPGAALAYLVEETGVAQLAGPAELRGMQEALRRSGERGLTLAQAVTELMKLGVVELPRQGLDEDNCVRLLTIHKAKGLESRVVFLSSPQVAWSQTLEMVVDDNRKGFLCLKGVAQPPHWPELLAREKERAEAEQIRLLYVAATRARETLVVSRGGERSAWRPLEPYLEEAHPLPQPDLCAETPPSSGNRAPGQLVTHPSWRKVRLGEGRRLLKPVLEAEVPGLDARDWGHLVHSLLERAVGWPELDVEAWARWSNRNQPRMLGALPRALALVQAVRETQLSQWLRESEPVLVEVPFGHREGNRLRFGTVDLALRRGSGWGLIDYKSDRQTLEVLTEHYAGQMEKYAHCWSDILREITEYSGVFSIRELELSVDLTPPGKWMS